MSTKNTTKKSSLDDQTPEPASASNTKALKIVLIVVAVFIILGILGTAVMGLIGATVGKKIVEEVTNTQIETNDDGINIKSKDGDSTFQVGSSAELPDDFPSGVPIFEPNSIASTTSSGDNDRKTWMISFASEKSMEEIGDFYKDELSKNGWKQTTETSTQNARQVSASHAREKLELSFTVTADGGTRESTFSLFVTKIQ